MVGLPVRAEIVGPGRYGEVREVTHDILVTNGVEAQFFSESSPGEEFEKKASTLLMVIHNTVAIPVQDTPRVVCQSLTDANKKRVKFFFVNFAHNRDRDRERPRASVNPSSTVADMLRYCIQMWSSTEIQVTEQDVRDMCDHLLSTGQITTHDDGGVTVGKVLFEKDWEGVVVTEQAEVTAREILTTLDDRRGSPTQHWADDVRQEVVNSWAATIDKHMKGTGNAK